MKCGKMYLMSLFDRGLCAECEKAEQEPIEKITIWGGEQFVGIETYQQVCKERDIAIEQLHELGYELGQKIEPGDDAINRQAALDLAYDMSEIDGEHFTEPCMVVDVEDIRKLPSVTPQQKIGHWINNQNGTFTCDICGCNHSKSNYCPNCGAKMVEPQESEDKE